MASKGQAIRISFLALDTSANAYKTGDAANITMYWKKDSSSPAVLASPTVTEDDATHTPGQYSIAVSGTETTCDFGRLSGKSSTANIMIISVGIAFENLPTAAPAASNGLQICGSNAAVTYATWTSTGEFSISGTSNVSQTGDSFARIGATGSGLTSITNAITNLQNNTFIGTNIPDILERIDASSETIPLTVTIADETGAAADIDASALPTVVLVNNAGTSRASRLSSWTHAATGKYTATYTNSVGDGIEMLHWEITATVNTKVRRWVGATQIVDTTAVDFTSADRTMLTSINTNADTTISSRAATSSLPAHFSSMVISGGGVVGVDVQYINGAADGGALLYGFVNDYGNNDNTVLAKDHTGAALATSEQALAIKTVTDLLNGMFDSSTPRKFTTPALSNAPSSSSAGTGDGDTLVDHNTNGTDSYRCLDENNEGIDNMLLEAFLATDYAADVSTAAVKGSTYTGSDGRWKEPLRLNSGIAYVIVGSAGRTKTKHFDLTVP